jgi:hypothetical protein
LFLWSRQKRWNKLSKIVTNISVNSLVNVNKIQFNCNIDRWKAKWNLTIIEIESNINQENTITSNNYVRKGTNMIGKIERRKKTCKWLHSFPHENEKSLSTHQRLKQGQRDLFNVPISRDWHAWWIISSFLLIYSQVIIPVSIIYRVNCIMIIQNEW